MLCKSEFLSAKHWIFIGIRINYGGISHYHFLFYSRISVWLGQFSCSDTFSCGIIVTTIGIVGVYVGRAFEQSKGRQLFIIDKRINL